MTHEELLYEAIRLSHENQESGGGPFGAVVAREGRIIAATGNRVTATNDPTAHAEVCAIRLACERVGDFSLAGCEIYSSCEPCPMCLGAIYWARLDALHFAATRTDAADTGFDDAFLYTEIGKPIGERAIQTVHIEGLQGYATAAFVAWQERTGRTEY